MADIELTPEIRFNDAELHLIELLRLYYHRQMLSVDSSNGEPKAVNTVTFVKREMAMSHLKFPFDEAEKTSTKAPIKTSPIWMLTTLFQRAVIEYKRAYAAVIQSDEAYRDFAQQLIDEADARCEWMKGQFPSFETAEIVPYHENSDLLAKRNDPQRKANISFLCEIGKSHVSSAEDIRDIFYGLSVRGRQLDESLIDVIVNISDEPAETMKMLQDYKIEFNNLITRHRIKNTSIPSKDKSKYEYEIEQLNNRIANLENKLEKSQKPKIYKTQVERQLLKQLLFCKTRFYNSFNFEEEKDCKEYISWFALAKRRIKMTNIRYGKDFWRFSPEAWDRFILLIEQHNAKFTDEVEEENE